LPSAFRACDDQTGRRDGTWPSRLGADRNGVHYGDQNRAVVAEAIVAGPMVIAAGWVEIIQKRPIARSGVQAERGFFWRGKPCPVALVRSIGPSPQVAKAMLSRKIVEIVAAGVFFALRCFILLLITGVHVSDDQQRPYA